VSNRRAQPVGLFLKGPNHGQDAVEIPDEGAAPFPSRNEEDLIGGFSALWHFDLNEPGDPAEGYEQVGDALSQTCKA